MDRQGVNMAESKVLNMEVMRNSIWNIFYTKTYHKPVTDWM
jgi:hypothetical protein